ncbi:MAG: DUF4010 domain-containing protein [Sulfurospirillaceae bacterium]|nr:DUF4010 domain-containing protein [Sulfurospirillaceae bacterium]
MTFNSDLTHFALTVVFSFLIGLEIKAYRLKFHSESTQYFMGTARTFTFIGILGFIFYKIDVDYLSVYIVGMLGFTMLYMLFYNKALANGKHSILLYIVMLLVYTFGPMTDMYPLWMSSLVFVLIVFVLNAKQSILNFTTGVDAYEFETLGKMVLLSAVILPLLPTKNVIPYVPLSPFKIWLSVVVISGISYGGYIAQKYIFQSKGLFLTGLIGGIYSSTATTVVLAKKSKKIGVDPMITASIIGATSMMYLRLIAISFIFNFEIAKFIYLPFLIFAILSFMIALIYYRSKNETAETLTMEDKNPLELGTAFIFAILFLFMMVATHFVLTHSGITGLKFLSFIVGFTDIDPFVLSLLNGKYAISAHEIYTAIVISVGSNNILKAVYALWFGGFKKTLHSFLWLLLLGLATIGFGIYS